QPALLAEVLLVALQAGGVEGKHVLRRGGAGAGQPGCGSAVEQAAVLRVEGAPVASAGTLVVDVAQGDAVIEGEAGIAIHEIQLGGVAPTASVAGVVPAADGHVVELPVASQ